ncbi:membrane bound O-acyl transferase family-domain-containing protein [Biscogniauxia mediterranea]|nr:membrane bound O-acyl transferase family-domain-containing protein [Biscogniauxia mediterranea]
MSYHPLFDLFAVVGLTATVIGFTPALSPLRTACLPLLMASTWHCLSNCPAYISRSSWASAVGGYTLSSLLHYVDVAVLSGWSFELHGPAKDLIRGTTTTTKTISRESQQSQLIARIKFGFSVFFSWRFVNTPYQVRNVPRLDAKLRSSRARFLAHTALTIIICYLVLDIMDSSSDAEVTDKFYSLEKIGVFSRIHDVSLEELVMRFFAAVGLCAGLVSFQRGVYSIWAFVCVATGLSTPDDWPPFNGPILHTYSLRYFWSTFWHQINTHRLNVMSYYLLHDMLGLKRGSKLVRYMRIWLIFLISGIWHVAIDFSSGISPRHSGALRFFSVQPLGIIIEDMILMPYTANSRLGKPTPTIARRVLGLLWVSLWMAWTAPGYLYPIMDKSGSPDDDGVVPISIINYLRHALTLLLPARV